MQDLMDKEKNKWRKILHRGVEVIKFLCKQNLSLRDHREDSNSRNQENFLETLKLLAKYNAVIKEHLSVIQLSSKAMTTYFLQTIQNELIELLGRKVVKRVIGTRCSAHYKAVKALQHYFLDVVSALNELCDQNENIDTRGQASSCILDAIQRFSFVFFTILDGSPKRIL